ncbi:MAG: hypothetical protein EAX95_07790, partial [Candidatus Thorarchaeota archaeon]|nr:hypothetical protein [Candidatus Thorarchaeota archaeon]
MERTTLTRFVLPAIVVLVIIIGVVILGGIASENPDGFEWALFDFAGVEEPEGGFPGIFSFLGEGPLVDVLTGALGIVI